jgi:hypothetical protein
MRTRGANSALSIARFQFGEVHGRFSDMVYVVCENIEHDVGDGLNDVFIGQAGGTRLLEIAVAEFTALHHNGARKLQDGVGFFGPGVSMTGRGDVILCKASFDSDEGVRAQLGFTGCSGGIELIETVHILVSI